MSEPRGIPWGRIIFLTIQVIIAAALMVWIFRQPGFTESFVTAWKSIHPGWLLAGVAVAGASVAAHVWRWWICLRLLGISVGWARLSGVLLASSFIGTFIIGGIGGDAARVMMLTRQFPGNASRLMVSVVADRLCGLVSLALPALVFTLPVREVLSRTPVGAAALHFLWGYLVLATALFVFSIFCGTERARRHLPKWMPGRDWMIHVSECFEMLRPSGIGLFGAIAASVLMLTLHFATFWCIAKGCGAEASLVQIHAVLPAIEAATTVPATPGGLGMREELFRDLLGSLCGTPAGAAVLISLGGFLCGLLWCLAGGLAITSLLPRSISLSKNGLSGTTP